MKLYFVRHTSVSVPEGYIYGQSEVVMSPSFTDEVAIIRQSLPDFPTNIKIWSSPLQRCAILSKILFPDKNIHFDDRLKELNFGLWEGKKWSELTPLETKDWFNDFVNTSCPKGEAYKDLHERTGDFLVDCRNEKVEAQIIVAHGGSIRSMLTHLRGLELKNSFKIEVPYGKVIVEEV